jgi:hypothetical protein
MATTDKVYIVVTRQDNRGMQATTHTKGSAIPKGWDVYPGFETLSHGEAIAKARKVGKPVKRASRRPAQANAG